MAQLQPARQNLFYRQQDSPRFLSHYEADFEHFHRKRGSDVQPVPEAGPSVHIDHEHPGQVVDYQYLVHGQNHGVECGPEVLDDCPQAADRGEPAYDPGDEAVRAAEEVGYEADAVLEQAADGGEPAYHGSENVGYEPGYVGEEATDSCAYRAKTEEATG